MKLIIEIKFGNDAMQNYADALAAISKIRTYRLAPIEGDSDIIRDANGNRVGKWEVIDNG